MTDVAIVTGASSGLGLEIARLLEARGLTVIDVSRRTLGDASLPETAHAALDLAHAAGNLRLLVNCAGAGIYGPAGSYDTPTIRRLIDANLIATIVFCNAVFPLFRASGSGTIVNVLSTAALTGKPNETVYCAAKWGARGYTEALRAEAKGTGVRILAASPGGMRTPFWPTARTEFMDPQEVAKVIVDAAFAGVGVAEVVIQRT
ncbi:MAG TPA: SDR family NAD(P)-dependent oxidoreductase [Thermoanaerobaculia bacterium]|jgi:short-subunit dehydrogenase|nr:SDR family NAD(P)-dependent oxidoreductase [Thermoanaerobaculia bacterium]